MDHAIRVRGLSKSFVLHNQGGIQLAVIHGVSIDVSPGECVVLGGPSGSGKSTLLKCIYGNYKATEGQIHVRHGDAVVDIATAEPRAVLNVRRHTLGYVSQFLRVIPRVATRDIVAEPLLSDIGEPSGADLAAAYEKAEALLRQLNVPKRLWAIPPATFSGGEQQRVNIARAFIRMRPILLLDEPTASLDAANRRVVVSMIEEARRGGTAMVGIFHDEEVRDAVATRTVDVSEYH